MSGARLVFKSVGVKSNRGDAAQHPHSIQVPDSALLTLNWDAGDAGSVNIDPLGNGLPAFGAQTIPTRDQTYTLVAVGRDGSTKSAPHTIEVHTHPHAAVVSTHAMVTHEAVGSDNKPASLGAAAASKVDATMEIMGRTSDEHGKSVVVAVKSSSVLNKKKTLTITRNVTGQMQDLAQLFASRTEELSQAMLTINRKGHPRQGQRPGKPETKAKEVKLGQAVISELKPPSGATQEVTFTYKTIDITYVDVNGSEVDDWDTEESESTDNWTTEGSESTDNWTDG